MKFASALTTAKDSQVGASELLASLFRQIKRGDCDVAFLFVHPQFIPEIEELHEFMLEELQPRHLVGCTGAGIIGVDSEIEGRPAISLMVGHLPGVTVTPFHITQEKVEEYTGPAYWQFHLEIERSQTANFVLLADPFSVDITSLVTQLSEAYPGAPLVGGLSSGARQPGENRLMLDEEIFDEGAIGMALTGRVTLHPIVAQGCKPIGEPLVVTRAEKNVLLELAGQPPIQVLNDLVPGLPAEDQQLARTSLLLGRVINEYQDEFRRGDFLIRNLIGQDPATGALAVGDLMRTGQTVQFHLRDGRTAEADLNEMLQHHHHDIAGSVPLAAVLFSCLGRGEGMYGAPHHDIRALHREFGNLPTAGFFCNGEIGPVGNHTYIHGFTSVIGLFCEPSS